jgi:hypothetical protein
MRKMVLLALCIMLTAPLALAQTPKFGAGVFGGVSIPVVQKDQASGTEFGLRLRAKVLSFLTAEPNLTFTKWGKPDPVEGITLGIDGSKVTAFGLDVTFGGLPGGSGFKPFMVLGAASYKVKNDATQYDQSKLGFSGGFGFAIGFVPMFDIDLRTKAVIIPTEGGGSKKAVSILGGLSYNF